MSPHLNYAFWKEKHTSILGLLNEKTVVVSFSGGKDSSVLLHFLSKASREYGFTFEAHGVSFPRHVFTPDETARVSRYWKGRNIDILWHGDDAGDDFCLKKRVDSGESPCVRCSEVKKNALFSHFQSTGSDLGRIVVVLGYSLWDLVSASLEMTLRTKLSDTGQGCFQGRSEEERLKEISQRFFPILELNEGLTVFKPLIAFNDPEINSVITRNRIPLIATECRYKGLRPKRLLSDYYTTFGLDFDYTKLFNFAKSMLDLPDINYFQNIATRTYVEKMI